MRAYDLKTAREHLAVGGHYAPVGPEVRGDAYSAFCFGVRALSIFFNFLGTNRAHNRLTRGWRKGHRRLR